jgi:hypothetical protein
MGDSKCKDKHKGIKITTSKYYIYAQRQPIHYIDYVIKIN